ncbi:MAG: hypothetical protein JWO57_666 [Pseudonocardiales bacterium]|nr:hypothetical protein [Pseudonocardiales bacterium]
MAVTLTALKNRLRQGPDAARRPSAVTARTRPRPSSPAPVARPLPTHAHAAPPAASVPAPAAASLPADAPLGLPAWLITFDAYLAERRAHHRNVGTPAILGHIVRDHEQAVRDALIAGLPVPDEVLKQHPHFRRPAGRRA